jgi:hypothetical protein
MNTINTISNSDRYARCIQSSKRVRWDVDETPLNSGSSSRNGTP